MKRGVASSSVIPTPWKWPQEHPVSQGRFLDRVVETRLGHAKTHLKTTEWKNVGEEKRDEWEKEMNTMIFFLTFFFFSFSDNTAGIITQKDGYSRSKMNTYLLPVLIFDNDYPIQSSTGTLTIRVCACDNQGNMQSCNAEALMLAAGLSTGALIAILLCVIILLSKTHISQTSSPAGLLLHCPGIL